jgi:hypothetical protein
MDKLHDQCRQSAVTSWCERHARGEPACRKAIEALLPWLQTRRLTLRPNPMPSRAGEPDVALPHDGLIYPWTPRQIESLSTLSQSRLVLDGRIVIGFPGSAQ